MTPQTGLPVQAVASAVASHLAETRRAVLVAPPGAGKTTYIPLHLLENLPKADHERILLLEPRRIAARAAAHRMAQLLGQNVGETIGTRMRLETRVSKQTRIEVVTEGVLQRMILDDPELSGVAAIIFDEYHERSIDADFGLALALDIANALRQDLALLVMSATLDGARVATLLGPDTPVIESKGRMFPVKISYQPRGPATGIEDAMASAIRTALMDSDGSVLAFLPGQAEIRRTAARLQDRLAANVSVHELFGAMRLSDQTAAIAPAPQGQRKVVLATAIAETSITIDGVRIVIDSGLARRPHFDLSVGVTRLETVRVSKAEADQRAGRAGRTAPGCVVRLWSEPATQSLANFAPPEILQADLSRLVLDALAFGVGDLSDLAFLDPPPRPAINQARETLCALGALDDKGALTKKGKFMQALPMGVREAAMVADGRGRVDTENRAQLALLLSERGLGGDMVDMAARFDRMRRDTSPRAKAVRSSAARFADRIGCSGSDEASSAGVALLSGFADRLAKRRSSGAGTYLLANGRAARLDETDPLAKEDWLVIADLSGQAAGARIVSAAPISWQEVERHAGDQISETHHTRYDPKTGALSGERRRTLGAITLARVNEPIIPGANTINALVEGVRTYGIGPLGLRAEAGIQSLVARLQWLHSALGGTWPTYCDDTLAQDAEHWLASYLIGVTRLADVPHDQLRAALLARAGQFDTRTIDRLAPPKFDVPTGSSIRLDYPEDGSAPVLRVRVQEMFGCAVHPTIADGQVPLIVELLSPAQRPIQRTTNLPAFWSGSWADVRADMRGRYPKHAWPDDPATAAPTRRAKPRGT